MPHAARRRPRAGKEANYLAQLKLISPLLSNMEVVQCISTRGGTSVYTMRSTKSGQIYILKHISVPESQTQVDALIYTGAAASAEEAQKYYEQVVADYQKELETLESLSSSPNLAAYRSYQIEPKEDAVGYDVYLLAEQRKTLVEYLNDNAMTQLTAVNLGMDLCNALVDLRAAGLIHRDVKPSNIYLNAQGHFVLGDLGIAKIDELKYCSMPEHMLSSYSAPELFELVGTIDPTTDIYSTGLILYRIFNGNHGPFEDEKTTPRAADKLRVTGEALPAPMYADYEMAEIILKACAFKPEDRYKTPDEFRQALVDYMKRNQLTDTLIVPPIVADPEPIDTTETEEEVEPVQFADAEALPEDFKQNFSPDTDMLSSIIESVHQNIDEAPGALLNSLEPQEETDKLPEGESSKTRKRRKPKKKWPIITAVIVLLLALGAAAWYFLIYSPATLHINGISVVTRDTNAISVKVDTNEKSGTFSLVCSDAYGNTTRAGYTAGQDVLFTELTSGTEYTITAEPANGERLTGTYTLRATTVPETNILSFDATGVSISQVELNLTLNGPDPGIWSVSYYADGVEPITATFSGHSTTIANLQSGKEYTFELQEPEGTRLRGVLTASYSTVPTVDIVGSLAIATSSSSVVLSWNYEGDAPESWTVTLTGPNDYSETQVVTAPTATFEDLVSGEDYTVVISAPNMLQSCTATITPRTTELTSFEAALDEETGSIRLDWTCKVDPAENKWRITYQLDGVDSAEPVSVETDTASYVFPSDTLIPNASYTVTLALVSGEKLEGYPSTLGFSTQEAEKHSLSVYPGLFLCPDKEDWTIQNLGAARTEFSTSEKIAYVLEATSDIPSNDGSVSILAVIHNNSDGKVVDLEESSAVWKDMWTNKKCTGSFPRTPQTPGKYTLSIYFNRKLSTTVDFTVKAS